MIMRKKGKRPQRHLLDAAREYQDALEAAGLPPRAIESYEVALRGVEWQARAVGGAAQVLVREIQREVEEFQAAVRKEFPGNVKFQAVFDAQRPLPASARDVLALGRHDIVAMHIESRASFHHHIHCPAPFRRRLTCRPEGTYQG